MNEQDPLSALLREWRAPESSPGLDARVHAAWSAGRHRPWWLRIWSVRVSIPVPALPALLLIGLALWFQFRPRPRAVVEPGGTYVTRIESAGFRPLPDGEIRVIRSGGKKE